MLAIKPIIGGIVIKFCDSPRSCRVTFCAISLAILFKLFPMNILVTGSTFLAQIRYEYDDAAIAASFTCVVTSAVAGTLSMTLSSASSQALVAGPAFWDLQRTTSGVVNTLLAGKCTILHDVTR
jgi:hypothetical protein